MFFFLCFFSTNACYCISTLEYLQKNHHLVLIFVERKAMLMLQVCKLLVALTCFLLDKDSFHQDNLTCLRLYSVNPLFRVYIILNIYHDFFDAIMAHSFCPKITYPTRFSNTKGTLIDNMICKINDLTPNTTSGIMVNKFSDHQPCFVCFYIPTQANVSPRMVKIKNKLLLI